MPSATTKGYPYPLGTDRVMDGDDAIKALAEAIEADANYTRAVTTGQSMTMNTLNKVSWQAPVVNTAALTKTSATLWTVTKPGLYVVSAVCITTAFSPTGQRSYMQLTITSGATSYVHRQTWMGENTCCCTVSAPLVAGDTIEHAVWPYENTSIQASTGWLHALRMGRT